MPAFETETLLLIALKAKMSVIATSLAKALPKPKDTGNYEVFPNHGQTGGPRIIEEGTLLQNQIAIKVCEQPSGQMISFPNMCASVTELQPTEID